MSTTIHSTENALLGCPIHSLSIHDGSQWVLTLPQSPMEVFLDLKLLQDRVTDDFRLLFLYSPTMRAVSWSYVHPDTMVKEIDSKTVALWVQDRSGEGGAGEICVRCKFKDESMCTSFVETFKFAQKLMAEKYAKSRTEWAWVKAPDGVPAEEVNARDGGGKGREMGKGHEEDSEEYDYDEEEDEDFGSEEEEDVAGDGSGEEEEVVGNGRGGGGFAKFQPKEGDWKCEVCSVSNHRDAKACVACETPNPKEQPMVSAAAATTAFSFAGNASTAASAPAFSFAKREEGATKPSGGFSFPSSSTTSSSFNKPADNATANPTSGFSFTPATTSSTLFSQPAGSFFGSTKSNEMAKPAEAKSEQPTWPIFGSSSDENKAPVAPKTIGFAGFASTPEPATTTPATPKTSEFGGFSGFASALESATTTPAVPKTAGFSGFASALESAATTQSAPKTAGFGEFSGFASALESAATTLAAPKTAGFSGFASTPETAATIFAAPKTAGFGGFAPASETAATIFGARKTTGFGGFGAASNSPLEPEAAVPKTNGFSGFNASFKPASEPAASATTTPATAVWAPSGGVSPSPLKTDFGVKASPLMFGAKPNSPADAVTTTIGNPLFAFQIPSPTMKPKPFSPKMPSSSGPSKTHLEILTKFYEKYNPEKLGGLLKTLESYKGREEELYAKLETKYNASPLEGIIVPEKLNLNAPTAAVVSPVTGFESTAAVLTPSIAAPAILFGSGFRGGATGFGSPTTPGFGSTGFGTPTTSRFGAAVALNATGFGSVTGGFGNAQGTGFSNPSAISAAIGAASKTENPVATAPGAGFGGGFAQYASSSSGGFGTAASAASKWGGQ